MCHRLIGFFLRCARPDRHEIGLMPVYIISQRKAHHGAERAGGKLIIRVFIHPFKKRLAQYLEFFELKILALPGKPLDLIRCQRLGNDRINLVSVIGSERMD
jgi:hypothetical protein